MRSTGGMEQDGAGRGLSGPGELDGEQMLPLEGGSAPWRQPSEDSRSPRPPRVSAGAEALIGAGAGLLVLPGLGQLQRQVLIRSEPLFIVGMTLCLGASFLAAAAAHRWLGGGRRRDAGAVGVVASLLAGTAWGAVTISGGWGLWQYLPPRSVLWAAALGSAVLAVRTTGVGARLAGALAGVLTMVAVVSATQTGWPVLASSLAADPRPAGAAPVEEVAGALPLAPLIAAGTS